MVFSSVVFLAYFLPLLLLLYTITPHRFRNLLLLIASVIFYSWGAPRFIFVILGTTLLDFFLVAEMAASGSRFKKRALLVLSVCMNLGLLFYFKYCNFFIDNLNSCITLFNGTELKLLDVILPIGISFYTFESLTYVVDVYRGVHKPLQNFWHYQLYIILFPKLIAGPIVRYHEIADQITDRRANDNIDNKILGFLRFCIGLGKKVFIANSMAVFADNSFNVPPEALSTMMAWTGMISYTFQIYFDFSGYSDMAIGLGLIFGFRFPENFNNPYVSGSITEFWRRWHMTLGNWMRNYLYIPLGGNRVKSEWRMYLNLCLVFLASGFWHGAAWTFIAWGAYHGIFLVLERIFLKDIYSRIGRLPSTIITFFLVAFGWVLFRADNIQHATQFFTRLFTFSPGVPDTIVDRQFVFYFLVSVFFSFFAFGEKGKIIQEKVFFQHKTLPASLAYTLLACVLFTIALAALAASDFNPFIYFRF